MKVHFQPSDMVLRARVTPDTVQADALRKKLESLSYQPSNGFHKDQWVPRRHPSQSRARQLSA
jgi:hypothetical protein